MNDYERIARVIRYLDEHQAEQPSLDDLAHTAGLSPFHFHRLFSNWAGITPKDFLQCLTMTRVKERLKKGQSVLTAALDAGLSGPGRLHDLCVNLEAATPGEIKAGGAGWTIHFGFAETPLGDALIAEGPRGICHLSFVETPQRKSAVAQLKKEWPSAEFRADNAGARKTAARLFYPKGSFSRPLRAYVKGTEFQVRVWRALLNVPSNALVSYGQLAAAIGKPSASRAVGTAVGQNSLAFLIPCHRVIRETGVLGNYRWGSLRKRAMLAWES